MRQAARRPFFMHSTPADNPANQINNAGSASMAAITPKDAAAVILLRPNTDPDNPEVYLVKRSSKLAFLGGFQAFPGGHRETADGAVQVKNCEEQERPAMLSCR